ncbi:MAG: glycerate kinase, partial [Erysipelotrichaceae bacterium]|nr:glycerate kinase [Erysipelotrichaceae bacterium]
EGRTDWQSCFGKVMQGVGERSARKDIVAVGLSGSLGRDASKIFEHGIESLITSVDSPMQIEEAISRAEELYYLAAVRMFRFIKAGMKIARKQ